MNHSAHIVPPAPVCPVSHSKGNGTAGHGVSGAGQGTEGAQPRASLKTLARQALSGVVPRGTESGTPAGQVVPEVRDKPDSRGLLDDGMCPHIPEKARRHAANVGRIVRCCACFLEAHPNWKPRGPR
jgi:hypothetical protein